MTTAKPLTIDDARALLSDHLEGALDEDVRAAVDGWLEREPALARERDRLAETMALLGGLEVPAPPEDMVARVRRALADERRAGASGHDVAAEASSQVVASWTSRRGRGAALLFASVVGGAVCVGLWSGVENARTGAPGTTVAALGGGASTSETTFTVTRLPRDAVVDAAARAGVELVGDDVYEGAPRDVARFLMLLQEAAATRGADVAGSVPDGERVRVRVRAQP